MVPGDVVDRVGIKCNRTSTYDIGSFIGDGARVYGRKASRVRIGN
jgi:hypothetical protein